MKRLTVRTMMAIAVVLALSCGGIVAVPGARALSVPEVQVVPNVARTKARYAIDFTLEQPLAEGESVLLKFPLGTALPCSPCNPYVYQGEVTVNDVNPKQPAYGNPTAGTLRVFVPEPLSAGASVRIVVGALGPRVVNPDSGVYAVTVSTDHEPAMTSRPYTIGTSHVATPVVRLESPIANANSGYTITFLTGVTGQLVQEVSTVTITYGAGCFPAVPVNSAVTVNGTPVRRAIVNEVKRTMDITMPVTVDAQQPVTIAIGAGFGLKNPAKAGEYSMYLHTSSEPGDIVSEPFIIKDVPTVASTILMGPGVPDGANGWYLSEPLVTLMAASNVPGDLVLRYGIDTEPTELYAGPFAVPAGNHTLRFQARNVGAGLAETVREQSIKVALAGPEIIMAGSESQLVTSSAYVLRGSVKVVTAAVVSVDVLGRPTHVLADGTFSEPLTLFEGANELRVTATDESGRTTSKTIVVTVDSAPPKLSVTSPANWQEVHADKVMVRGTIELGAVLQVNGMTVSNSMPDGSFAHEVALAVGSNTITVTAQDAAGNTRRVAVLVTRVPANETTIVLTIGNKDMTVNGTKREIDPGRGTTPVIQNGRTLVPVAAIIQALGGEAVWNAAARTVTITLGDTELVLAIGGPTAYVNGKPIPIDADPKVVPVILNSRTMLPFRFIAERLGGTVEWNAATKTVVLHFGAS
jgi:uncharacterized protein YfaP (DUF2135 family)